MTRGETFAAPSRADSAADTDREGNPNVNRHLLPALALGAVVAMAGCAAQPEVVSGQAEAADEPTALYTPPPVPTQQIYAPPVSQQQTAVGQLGVDTVDYPDGLQVALSTAHVYKPGRWSAGHDNAVGVRLEITITNNGSEAFDPSLFLVNASYADQPASQIFDSQNDISGAPQTTLLPGKSIKFPVAFSIPEGPGELQVDVQPSFSHDSAVFVGPVNS